MSTRVQEYRRAGEACYSVVVCWEGDTLAWGRQKGCRFEVCRFVICQGGPDQGVVCEGTHGGRYLDAQRRRAPSAWALLGA